jgi:hypothetical protein
MVTKTRSRLTMLEKSSSTDGDVIVILDTIDGTITWLDETGDYHHMTPEEYDQVKDEVITVRIYEDITSKV